MEKKIWTYLCLLIFTSILLIGYSNHAIDANMYHHPYVSYLKSEKIIISIANIQFRFGHISLMQYVQSALTNDFLSPLSLSSLNIIFFTFFLIYCGEILFKKNKNNLIFLIVLFFSCFVLIKMGRYREFGNDLIPFLVCSYFFIRILKEKNNQNNHKSIFIYLPIFACFMISHKITYVFSALIFISIISKQNLIFIFKEKKFLLFSISFAFLWFLKTYVETSCLIYPVVQTCIKNSKDIPIEERNSDELSYIEGIDNKNQIKKVLIYPNKSKAMNLAFDVTPAKYVTSLITEKGICDASSEALKNLFNKN